MAAHASVIACQRRVSVGAAVVRHLAWLVDQHAARGAKAGASGGRERSRPPLPAAIASRPPAAWGAWRWSSPPTGPSRHWGSRTAGTQARNAPPSPTPAARLAATPPPRAVAGLLGLDHPHPPIGRVGFQAPLLHHWSTDPLLPCCVQHKCKPLLTATCQPALVSAR